MRRRGTGRDPAATRIATILLIAPLLLQAAYVVAPLPERWPLSTFPMFSKQRPVTSGESYSFVGVTPAGEEVRLDRSAFWQPVPVTTLRVAIGEMERAGPTGERALEDLLDLLKGRYRRARSAGEHAGPAIAALRVYRVRWDWSEGVHAPRIARRLVLER